MARTSSRGLVPHDHGTDGMAVFQWAATVKGCFMRIGLVSDTHIPEAGPALAPGLRSVRRLRSNFACRRHLRISVVETSSNSAHLGNEEMETMVHQVATFNRRTHYWLLLGAQVQTFDCGINSPMPIPELPLWGSGCDQ